MKDNWGRKINYARISITDRCNLRCVYCMPETGVIKKEHNDILKYEEIDKIINALDKLGIDKIRFTGGEPLVRSGFESFLSMVIKKYVNISFFITTNGLNFYENADNFKNAGLKGINFSLDTLDKDNYKKITRGGNVDKVINSIKKAVELNFPSIKINAVLSKDLSHVEIKQLIDITIDNNIDVRFIELMPMGDCAEYGRKNFVHSDLLFHVYPTLAKIEKEDISSPADYFKLPNAKGNIGIISPMTCKFCHNCNRIRITSDGKLKPCLHSDDEIDLLSILSSEEELLDAIEKSIIIKPKEHNLETMSIKRNMKNIGG